MFRLVIIEEELWWWLLLLLLFEEPEEEEEEEEEEEMGVDPLPCPVAANRSLAPPCAACDDDGWSRPSPCPPGTRHPTAVKRGGRGAAAGPPPCSTVVWLR